MTFIRDSDYTFEAVKQGDRLQLVCQAQGGPNNMYIWKMEDEDIQETSVLTIETIAYDTISNSTLTVSSVNASEHKGNYTCQVINNGGKESASILVIGT